VNTAADAGPDLIAFDGDDTLWHNERSYREGRERFRRLLARAGVTLSPEEVERRVNLTEVANLPYYGYGVSSFVLSLAETAIEVTDGRIAGGDLRDLIDLAKHMLTEEVELFPGAQETLTTLAASSPLMLITKGDLRDQHTKMARSGLRTHFIHVEVVSEKTAATYEAILRRHRVSPRRFLMVGNSLKSDVLPVLALGATAVYVPHPLTWAHEAAETPGADVPGYHEIADLAALPALLERLEEVED